MKRPADQDIANPNARRVRLSTEQVNSFASEEEKVWAQKQEHLVTLDVGSPDLYACFLSAVSLLRRHFSEDDSVVAHTGLGFETVFDLEAEKWECNLSHPSSTITYGSGLFTREDLATCWVVFVACRELGLGYPEVGISAANKPTHALACIGEKLMKMIYALQGFATFPRKDEGELTKHRSDRLCNKYLLSCADDLAVSIFLGRNEQNVVRFVRTAVASAYYRGGLALVLTVSSGLVGPMPDIFIWSDLGRLFYQSPLPIATVSIPSSELAIIEGKLGYKFRRGSIITESLAHGSLSKGVGCKFSYERLEYLGDSVVDLLAALFFSGRGSGRQIYEHVKDSTCNAALGALCIELNYHSHLRHKGLSKHIAKGEAAIRGKKQDPRYWTGLSIPKACFANIIESAFGAVFADSGFNIQVAMSLFDKIAFPFYDRNFPRPQ
ncbi:Dicer-like protein 1 [Entomortierella lignicola]|nr:Dicer-like protein 1 [Entomortierella lignicola]